MKIEDVLVSVTDHCLRLTRVSPDGGRASSQEGYRHTLKTWPRRCEQRTMKVGVCVNLKQEHTVQRRSCRCIHMKVGG
jgi:hypothetical protein